jgi:hypothetical protein
MFGKKGKTQIDWPVILLGVLVVYLLFPAQIGGLTNSLAKSLGMEVKETPSGSGAGTGAVNTGACVDPTVKVTMTLNAEDAYAPTTVPGGDNRIWINGKDQGLVAQGSSLTVSPGDDYVILWVSNSTTYYGKVTRGEVPCSGTLRLKEELYPWVNSKASTTLFNVYNEQGQVGTALTTASGTYYNASLDAGDVETLKFEIKGVYKYAMSNPELDGDAILACKYNQTSYDDLVIDMDGFTDKVVTCPATQLVSATGFQWKCFAAPSLVSNEKVTGSLTVDVDDTYTPDSDANDIYCEIFDADYTTHTINGDIISGVEDDVNTNLGHTGTHDWNFTFHVA